MKRFSAWLQIFGKHLLPGGIGTTTKIFFKGVAAVGTFFVGAKALTSGTHLLAGRWLGPDEYGVVSLVIAGSTFLAAPFQLGFPSAVSKFVAMESSHEEQSEIISTVLWLNLLWASSCLIILFYAKNVIVAYIPFSSEVYLLSVVLAFGLGWNSVVGSSLEGLKMFPERGLIEFIYGGLFAAFFCGWNFLIGANHGSFIVIMLVSLCISALAATFISRKWIKSSISKRVIRNVRSYTLPPVINHASMALLMGAVPIIIAGTMSERDVGVFGMYRLGSLMLVGSLGAIICTVLGPLASSSDQQEGAWRKFHAIMPYLFLGGLSCFMISTFVVLSVAGIQYPIKLGWLLTFSLAATCSLLLNLVATLLLYKDVAGLWIGVLGMLLCGMINFGMALVMVPTYGILGAGLSSVIANLAGLVWCEGWVWRFHRLSPLVGGKN